MKIIKNIFYILTLFVLGSCLNEKPKQSKVTDGNQSVQEKSIAQTFLDVEHLLAIDDGKFWNKQLYGPILFVNHNTRVLYANENDMTDSFSKFGKIYKDSLSTSINIANTALNWNDKRWSMVMLPLPTDKTSRNHLIIHELFHRLQPEIGFENLQELDNSHLDTYNGRLMLKLELQALEQALKSNENSLRLTHIKNALFFRQQRQETLETKKAENTLELNEGLAEYTALMLSGRTKSDIKTHLIQSKTDFYTNPTFVRSFAYQTIPMYGYLLSIKNPNWHKAVDRNTNLTDYLINAFHVELKNNRSIIDIVKHNDYGYQSIINIETEREKKRVEKLAKLKIKFIENPTLELSFQNMNISFDPRNITPIGNFGTVYPNLRITDNWGILTVENDALLASNWSKVTVSAPTEISQKVVKGDGWQLELNPEWKVEKNGERFKLLKNEN